ncbi:MAG: NAD(P)/FAD-dependent oxidoreductase [Eubacteriales bacterium]|nr:NAD(P)/FAD-dependent oxidoreductase [Eubacteriales bacterium]
MTDVIVIGGGAAGMAAALFAAENGLTTALYEQNEKLGKKLFITGKGRCNFTNACSREELLNNVVTNPRFLYSAFDNFSSQQTIELFERLGVRTKVERGNRAFPASDHSSDIIRALEKRLKALDVKIHLKSKVKELVLEEIHEELRDKAHPQGHRVTGIRLENGAVMEARTVILAAGGLSYPTTGATGDGYRMAEAAGHSVQPLRPALVPLVTKEDYIPEMQGLSLKNVTLRIPLGKKKKYEAFGEMLFTHYGISGPLALSASSYVAKLLEDGELHAEIDLKPALSEEQLDVRILREFEGAKNKEFKNAAAPLFPSKMRPVMMKLCGIDPEKPCNAVTREERERFRRLIKAFPFTITGTGEFKEAIITQGGITVKEVFPATMQSRMTQGLYIVGEVLDLDALTGGFNLQIAWATAKTAADACAEALRQ